MGLPRSELMQNVIQSSPGDTHGASFPNLRQRAPLSFRFYFVGKGKSVREERMEKLRPRTLGELKLSA